MGAHNSVVGADQGFRAPSWDQESVHDAVHEDSASARIAIGQRPRPSFRHPHAPTRSEVTWSQLLRSQAAVACDFATIDTVTLRRFYLLFFVDIPTRTVYFAGITDDPSGVWTTQAARNLLLQHGHQLADAQALVRDRASQFIDAFDEIFRTEGMKILTTPVRTPVANAFAERWIGTLRRELLDRTIICVLRLSSTRRWCCELNQLWQAFGRT